MNPTPVLKYAIAKFLICVITLIYAGTGAG